MRDDEKVYHAQSKWKKAMAKVGGESGERGEKYVSSTDDHDYHNYVSSTLGDYFSSFLLSFLQIKLEAMRRLAENRANSVAHERFAESSPNGSLPGTEGETKHAACCTHCGHHAVMDASPPINTKGITAAGTEASAASSLYGQGNGTASYTFMEERTDSMSMSTVDSSMESKAETRSSRSPREVRREVDRTASLDGEIHNALGHVAI